MAWLDFTDGELWETIRNQINGIGPMETQALNSGDVHSLATWRAGSNTQAFPVSPVDIKELVGAFSGECHAWCKFSSSSQNPSIGQRFNVSSISWNGSGHDIRMTVPVPHDNPALFVTYYSGVLDDSDNTGKCDIRMELGSRDVIDVRNLGQGANIKSTFNYMAVAVFA
jgi:hypothetical protein